MGRCWLFILEFFLHLFLPLYMLLLVLGVRTTSPLKFGSTAPRYYTLCQLAPSSALHYIDLFI
ncbi:hypothetical protein BDW42DRAFT_103332 [Aspergillus taichungensis]|uniref:Uncharacterized protein n=1 Tax=Aspergillus taichungensis TaxID=482145 RepID=A0A2J5HUJ7_9EURO|nr:hypothetical protein BDW42DRAFT_103332 [Aspergillus taichungensis]